MNYGFLILFIVMTIINLILFFVFPIEDLSTNNNGQKFTMDIIDDTNVATISDNKYKISPFLSQNLIQIGNTPIEGDIQNILQHNYTPGVPVLGNGGFTMAGYLLEELNNKQQITSSLENAKDIYFYENVPIKNISGTYTDVSYMTEVIAIDSKYYGSIIGPTNNTTQ